MKITQDNFVRQLARHAASFEQESTSVVTECLAMGLRQKWKPGKGLLQYADLLLFLFAHPRSENMLRQVEACMAELGMQLGKSAWSAQKSLHNSGLPFTDIVTSFSHDLLDWLSREKLADVEIDSYGSEAAPLSDVLAMTLQSYERELLNYGYDDAGLLDALLVNEKEQLSFILSELSQLDHLPFLKDKLFESLGMYVKVSGKKSRISKFSNRFLKQDVFFHDSILKKFDHVSLLNSDVPPAVELSEDDRAELCRVVRLSLLLTARETDPSTFMDVSSLRLYNLERGISIALYGMVADRQLPLESYIGYTLFKNGLPCAYGGSWVFGRRALFGMNIFEPYRGGESGYLMCQLLRVYRHVFGISVFEVEPYQFGKDNPDGIKSGAFWFYYKYGFRPDDKVLNRLAEQEKKKISTRPGYFSSEKTLLRFTESFLVLEFSPVRQPRVPDFSDRITRYIHKVHHNNRPLARQKSAAWFRSMVPEMNMVSGPAFEEWTLLAAATGETDSSRLELVAQLIKEKAADPYTYQQVLLRWFDAVQAAKKPNA